MDSPRYSTSRFFLRWVRRGALATALVLVAACSPVAPELTVDSLESSASLGALAIPDVFAADAAENVLREGGNAVDAAIATAFVLAVTYPEAGNVGGGGFMLSHVNGEDAFLDYREVGPAAATRDMYLDEEGNVIPGLSLVGHLASGVPGTVAGLWAAHERYGTLPWARLVQPAIDLAEKGFFPPEKLLHNVAEAAGGFDGTNFSSTFAVLAPDELFRQADLAGVLRRIAEDGRDGFYHGVTADLLIAEMARGGGIVDAKDLTDYQPVWREPLVTQWRGFEVVSAPPPSSGGFAVIQLLEMKESLADDFSGLEHNSGQYVHLIAEMEKRVFADRAKYLGDSDVVDVPIASLIDEAYIHRRAQEVNPTEISDLQESLPGLEESPSTTHFSIVDSMGNAVSNTYTLNGTFGSGVVVGGAGFLLNNEMDDFSAKPGVPNLYGVVGAEANAIAPYKRMLSSMSPTLLLENGEVAMVLGTAGGSTIFTSVFQVIVNIVEFGMSPAEATALTRFHHQLLPPDLITYSPGRPLPEATVLELEQRGYRVQEHSWDFDDLQVVWRDGESLSPASDPRGRGVSRVLDGAQ